MASFGGIEKVLYGQVKFISPHFVVPKSSGRYRLVFNLKMLHAIKTPKQLKYQSKDGARQMEVYWCKKITLSIVLVARMANNHLAPCTFRKTGASSSGSKKTPFRELWTQNGGGHLPQGGPIPEYYGTTCNNSIRHTWRFSFAEYSLW